MNAQTTEGQHISIFDTAIAVREPSMTLFLNKRENHLPEVDQETQQVYQAQRQNHLNAAECLARASGCHKDAAMYYALGNTENAQKNIDIANAHIAKAVAYAASTNHRTLAQESTT